MVTVKITRESTLAIASALWLVALLLGPRAATAACVGDCNNNGSVTAGELTKIISIINLCGGMATGCAAIPGADKQCTNADRNGNGVISAGELTLIISNINSFPSGCPPESVSPTPTPTPTLPPSPTRTLTPTPTRTPTSIPPSPTATASATVSSNPTATLANIQTSILSTTCTDTSCHSSVGQAGNLVLEPGKSYAALVNVPPFNSSAQHAGLLRVKPGDPTNSFLLIKCTGPSPAQGSLMPLGKPSLTADQLQLMRDWITQGALP